MQPDPETMANMVDAARKELRNQGCLTGPICSFPPCACVERAIVAALAVMPKQNHSRRWNVEQTDSGFRICRGDHHRSQDCEWEYYEPEGRYRAGWIAAQAAAVKVCDELAKDHSRKSITGDTSGYDCGAMDAATNAGSRISILEPPQ